MEQVALMAPLTTGLSGRQVPESQGDREAATLGLPLLAVRPLLPHPRAPPHLGPTWEAEARKRTGRWLPKAQGPGLWAEAGQGARVTGPHRKVTFLTGS